MAEHTDGAGFSIFPETPLPHLIWIVENDAGAQETGRRLYYLLLNRVKEMRTLHGVVQAARGLEATEPAPGRRRGAPKPAAILLVTTTAHPAHLRLLGNLRRQFPTVPWLVIFPLELDNDLPGFLAAGVDDFLVTPLREHTFYARLTRLLYPPHPGPARPSPVYRDRHLSFDGVSYSLIVAEEPIPLTSLEYRVLTLLVEERGRVVPYERILRVGWGDDEHKPSDVHTCIAHLRRKLEPEPKQPRYLVNRHGVGYLFVSQG